MKPLGSDSRLLEDFLTSNHVDSKILFVCHASYEVERATRVTDLLIDAQLVSRTTDSLIVGTTNSIDAIAEYKECFIDLQNKLTLVGKTAPNTFSLSRNDLVGMTKAIHVAIGSILNDYLGIVVIDASVFPKDRLWILLDYFKHINSKLKIFIVYTEPDQYSTEIHSDGWLSKGVKRLIRIPGFNGRQNPKKKSLLVLIVGHEKERMEITIKNVEPHKIVLIGQGVQQHGNTSPFLSQQIINQLGSEYSGYVDIAESIEVGFRDHHGTESAIHAINERFTDGFNIIVAINGTKLQSLGALLACQKNRSLAAIYAEPQIYNSEKYSVGVGRSWVMSY